MKTTGIWSETTGSLNNGFRITRNAIANGKRALERNIGRLQKLLGTKVVQHSAR